MWIEQHFDRKDLSLCDQICQSLLNIKCKSTLMLKVGQIPRPKYGRFHLKIPTLHHSAWLLSRPSIAAPNFLSHPSSQYSPNDHPYYKKLTKNLFLIILICLHSLPPFPIKQCWDERPPDIYDISFLIPLITDITRYSLQLNKCFIFCWIGLYIWIFQSIFK